jgi:hypothetical protein
LNKIFQDQNELLKNISVTHNISCLCEECQVYSKHSTHFKFLSSDSSKINTPLILGSYIIVITCNFMNFFTIIFILFFSCCKIAKNTNKIVDKHLSLNYWSNINFMFIFSYNFFSNYFIFLIINFLRII